MAAPPRGLRLSNMAGTVWPPISLGGGAVLAALLSQLEATERLAHQVIEEMQGRQLGMLATHHRAHTPSFAARLKAAGLAGHGFDSLEALRRLPPIGRRDIQAAGAGFFSTRVPETHQPVHELTSNGSTGEPVTVRKTQLQSLLWSALTMRDLMWHGHDFSAPITTIRPQVTAYYERDGWGRPIDDIFASGRAQGIPIGTDIAEQARLIRRFETRVLVAFPSNLAAIAEVWEAEGSRPDSLRHIRTLSETVSEGLRARISRITGLVVEDNYSAQEAGSIAVQCPRSGLYHVMAESVIVEILDEADAPCAEGEAGRVVVTDLHNLATPLIRYDIGDYAEAGGPCPCGRGLPTLRRILGRERNLVLMPDGRRHWPLLGLIGQAFEKQAVAVRQFQLIQHTLTAMELRVVTDRPVTPAEEAAMTAAAQAILGYPFAIEVVRFEGRLPRGASGKFEDFMCRVARDPVAEDRAAGPGRRAGPAHSH